MHVWIITTGEHFPKIDGENVRLWRSVSLTDELLKREHSVVRWSAGFDHSNKTHRFENDHTEIVCDDYQIEFLKTPGYSGNVSLSRLYDHMVTAKRFRKLSREKRKPDLILCSLPTLELCEAATDYGKEYGVPVVLDVRDLWPDLFLDAVPKPLRFLGKAALYPMFAKARKACRDAFAFSGISESYIDWQLAYAKRKRRSTDQSFSHGYSDQEPSQDQIDAANRFWKDYTLDGKFVVCLFSAMGNVLELDPVFDAAKELGAQGLPISFMLCGDGVKLEGFRDQAKDIPNVQFPGWVDFPKIWSLMRIANVGILPYCDLENYRRNIPNKPIEYLSAGLPVLTNVRGLVKDLIEENNCGVFYDSNDASSLVNSLSNLYHNSSLTEEMSANAKVLFEKKFCSSKVYGQMADYLSDVADAYAAENKRVKKLTPVMS